MMLLCWIYKILLYINTRKPQRLHHHNPLVKRINRTSSNRQTQLTCPHWVKVPGLQH